MGIRGGSFTEMVKIFSELTEPHKLESEQLGRRIAVVHGGGLGPGMNPAARAAIRLGISRVHDAWRAGRIPRPTRRTSS